MAGLYLKRVDAVQKCARNSNVEDSRYAINFINFPLGECIVSVSFAPAATRRGLTPVRRAAIRAS